MLLNFPLFQGRNFSAIIKSFMTISGPLNDEYLPLYKTKEGSMSQKRLPFIVFYRKYIFIYIFLRFDLGVVYDATLASVKQSFPQYIRELEGVANGAEVEFHKVICTVHF